MVCSLGTNEYNQQWIHSSPKIADSSGVKMGGRGGGGGLKGIRVNNHSFWKVLLLVHDRILSVSVICCGNQV